MGEDEDEVIDVISLQVGDETVIRTSNEDCESCGGDAYGVLVPKGDQHPSSFDDGIVVCQECYNENNHYDDDTKYGIRLFNI